MRNERGNAGDIGGEGRQTINDRGYDKTRVSSTVGPTSCRVEREERSRT